MTEKKYEENSAPQKAISYPNHNPTLTLTLTIAQNGLVGTPRISRMAPPLIMQLVGVREGTVVLSGFTRDDVDQLLDVLCCD